MDTHDQEIHAEREEELTEQVIRSFDGAGSERYRELMGALVRHLHAFAREVRLNPDEWDTAIDFLTKAGHITDERRQEFILLSDVLGVSMLTVAMNSPVQSTATESTVFGPFFVQDAPRVELGEDISGGMTGVPCYVSGTVMSTDGTPIPGARIEVWAADDAGFYDVQYDDGLLRGRAHFFVDDSGAWDFWTVQPAAYPIPHDGPVGDLLTAAGRSPMRPAHIHFMVVAEGYETLITHIFVEGDEWLVDDAVFGVKQSLVTAFEQLSASEAPRGRRLDSGWSRAKFDIILAPSAS